MKGLLMTLITLISINGMANTWSYQVNVNGAEGSQKKMDVGKNSFEAGPYFCEVSPVTERNKTEYRTLICSFGTGTVSTGGLCTKREAKFPSLQYAILNLTGPKNIVNVVVACDFN